MDTTHTTRKRNRGNNNYSTDGDNKKVVKKSKALSQLTQSADEELGGESSTTTATTRTTKQGFTLVSKSIEQMENVDNNDEVNAEENIPRPPTGIDFNMSTVFDDDNSEYNADLIDFNFNMFNDDFELLSDGELLGGDDDYSSIDEDGTTYAPIIPMMNTTTVNENNNRSSFGEYTPSPTPTDSSETFSTASSSTSSKTSSSSKSSTNSSATSSSESSNTRRRYDKSLRKNILADDVPRKFRIAISEDNILLNKDIWRMFVNDLKIIAYVKNVDNVPVDHIASLSCTNQVKNATIYRDVMMHLPLKYAIRLVILRLICYLFHIYLDNNNDDDNDKNNARFYTTLQDKNDAGVTDNCSNDDDDNNIRILDLDIRKKIIHFFRNHVLPIESLSRQKDIVKDHCKNQKKKLRINLNTSVFQQKTWRPVVNVSLTNAIINSCKYICNGGEKLFLNLSKTKDAIEKNYFVDLKSDSGGIRGKGGRKNENVGSTSSSSNLTKKKDDTTNKDDDSDNSNMNNSDNNVNSRIDTLSEYKYEGLTKLNDKISVTYIRLNMIRLFCISPEICGLFSLKQLYGNGERFEKQCSLINKFIVNEISTNVNDTNSAVESTRVLEKIIGPRFEALRIASSPQVLAKSEGEEEEDRERNVSDAPLKQLIQQNTNNKKEQTLENPVQVENTKEQELPKKLDKQKYPKKYQRIKNTNATIRSIMKKGSKKNQLRKSKKTKTSKSKNSSSGSQLDRNMLRRIDAAVDSIMYGDSIEKAVNSVVNRENDKIQQSGYTKVSKSKNFIAKNKKQRTKKRVSFSDDYGRKLTNIEFLHKMYYYVEEEVEAPILSSSESENHNRHGCSRSLYDKFSQCISFFSSEQSRRAINNRNHLNANRLVGTHDALRRATNRRAGQVIFKRMELPEIERQARFKTLKIKYKTYSLHKTINQPGFNYLQKFERKAGPS